jgi:hypothetical protein
MVRLSVLNVQQAVQQLREAGIALYAHLENTLNQLVLRAHHVASGSLRLLCLVLSSAHLAYLAGMHSFKPRIAASANLGHLRPQTVAHAISVVLALLLRFGGLHVAPHAKLDSLHLSVCLRASNAPMVGFQTKVAQRVHRTLSIFY